jgi:oligopeptide transport system ATP-binding protein
MTLLQTKDLTVTFQTADGPVNAVNGVNFSIDKGETLAIVGESGSGKSQTAFAIMGLLARNGQATGQALFDGQDLLAMPQKALNKIRANDVAMIFQDPMTSLNPYIRISDQMAEVLTLHKGISKRDAIAQSVRMLDAVGIPDAKVRISSYPHEFSGGMRQRIMIAIALACRPQLLIADEPTTALDVTIQAQVLELITDIRSKLGMSVVLITHDLGVVAEHCDRMMVMYAGQVVEEGPTRQIISNPRHPYTRGLLASIPRIAMRGQPIQPIQGQVPDLINLPPQCRFYSRCAFRSDACLKPIAMDDIGPERRVRCIRTEEELV